MNWLVIVSIGHLLSAVSLILSKALLSDKLNNPVVFAFWVSAFGLITLAAIPFGVVIPSATELLLNFITGAAFTFAVLLLFEALIKGEASRIVPLVGGVIPIVSLLLERLLLGAQLNMWQLAAFGILVLGSIVITYEPRKPGFSKPENHRKYILFGIAAGCLYGLSFALTKLAFETQPFVSAFVWMRIGGFMAASSLLLPRKFRSHLYDSAMVLKTKVGFLFLSSQVFGGAGFILVNFSITLASVALVNAMQGVQYIFLMLMAVIASIKFPKLVQENLRRESLVFKIVGTIIISGGIYIIAQTAL